MKRYLAIVFCILLALVPAAGAIAAVNLPGNLQTIEAEAFAGDSSLNGVLSLPSSVTQIGDRAFADTNLYGLNVPSGIRQIGSGILSGTGAMFVQIPSATASVASDALADVTFLIAPQGTVSSAGLEQGVVWMESSTVFFHDGFAYQHANREGTAAVLVFPSVAGLSGEFTVPETVGGIPVVEVSPYGFTGLGGLTKVNVSSDVYMPAPSERVNWPAGLEINVQVKAVDPSLPDDREATQFYFSEESLTLHPGDDFWLSPNTDEIPDGEWSWHSSDDGIVTFGEDCYVQAHRTGTASVTLWIDAGEEGFYYATLTVRVVPADHVISITDDEITLPVGEVRVITWDFSSSSDNPNVELVFDNSDEGVIHLDKDIIYAVAPGTATATVTAIIDGVSVSDTVEVTVVESNLTLSENLVWAYDIFEYQVDIVTELPEDATIVWSSDNEYIHVSQTGLITVSGDEQLYDLSLVTCDVTYADGTTAQASVTVHCITNPVIFDEVTEPFTMTAGDEADNFLGAYIMYFPKDADQFSSTLASSDDGIVSVTEDNRLIAHRVGTVEITRTITFVGEKFSRTYQINVEPPHMWLEIEHPETEIWVHNGDLEMGCWYDCSIMIDGITVSVDNPDVAKAYVSNDRLRIIPVCEGHAVITVTMSAAGVGISDSIHVTVYGHTISLSQSSAEMQVGQSIQLSPVLLDGQEMDYNDRHYSSNDESIAVVDDTGRVTAMGTGSALIRFETRVNGEYAYAQCIVTVTDAEAKLTLNHAVLHMDASETVQMTAYWNGQEIDDASWSVTDSGLAITSSGSLYLRHMWPENHAAYVICTVERDGETHTATCMVTGHASEVSMDTPKLLVMGIGAEEWLGVNFSSTNVEETYTVRMTSSNPDVADFPYGDYNIRANAAGECTVTVELLDSKGSVVATRYCSIMVDVGIPELEELRFAQDVYFITTEEDNRNSAYLDPIVLPTLLWDLNDVTITSSNPDVAYTEEHEVHAISAGTATLTLYHSSYPDVTDTATVHVIDPQPSATATEIEAGSTVSFTLDGVIEDGLQNLWWEWDNHHFYYANGGWMELGLRGRNAGETTIFVHIEYPDMSFEYEFPVIITGEAKQLNINDLHIEPSCGEFLWPEFDAWDSAWSSTDESVAEVYEDGFVSAVGYGECDIILNCETPDGPYETACHVTVANGEWYLKGIDLHPALFLGDEFDLNAHIDNSYYAWPDEVVWSFSDDSMVEQVEGNRYRAVKTGKLVITVTATEGKQVETTSLTVIITEPAVRMLPEYGALRPGFSAPMELIIADGHEIRSVVWSTSNAGAMSVDENGVITMHAQEGTYSVSAAVTLTDGTAQTLSSIISAIPDHEVYFSPDYNDSHELTVSHYGDLELYFDTNAHEDEISITWYSMDESIVAIDSIGGYLNYRATILALQEGDVTVRCNVRIGDFIDETYDFNIHVNAPSLWIDLEHDSIDLYVRDDQTQIQCWYGNDIPYDVLSVVSSDPSVVKAYLVHNQCFLIPVSEGTATITATISSSGFGHYDTMEVRVHGSRLSLNVSEATLNVGQTLQLSPVFTGEQNTDYSSNRSYESSDASIAFVNGDGLVTGLKPGTARIRLQTRVNDEDSLAYCMITVVDESYPLTLNADTLTLQRGESFQLKALWNGTEINDAAWSTSNSSITISNSGLVTMHHISSEDHISYAICTVERDGKTYTASCMITGQSDGLIFECESAVSLNADGSYWFNPYWSTAEDHGELSVVVTSSNEKIARVEEDNRTITACAAGICTVTVKLVNADGQVLASKDVTIYVESDVPALESVAFGSDAYILDLGDSGQIECHADPRTEPHLYWETDAYGRLIITSANEDVVVVNEHNIRAVGTGTTTISLYHEAEPDMVVTVPVTVYNTRLIVSSTEPNVGDLVTVTVEGLEDAELEDFYINHDENRLRFVRQEGLDGHTFYFHARQGGQTSTQVHAFFGSTDFCYDTEYNIQGEALLLNMQEAFYEPGHEFDLQPEFGTWNLVWSSTDENVATVDDNGHVVVHNYGECDIVLNCMTENGEYTTSCHLTSSEGEWELKRIEIDDVLYVGNEYEIGCYFKSTDNAGPHDWVWSAEGDALEHIEDNRFRAVKTGTATIHLTAREGDHAESLSRTVQVVEPAVRPEQIYYSERPGTVIEPRFIVANGLSISGITMTADEEGVFDISDGSATLLATGGLHKLTAKVKLSDGTTHDTFLWVSVIPDEEVYWSLRMDSYIEMDPLSSRSLELQLDTNATEHEISIEWECSDENIVDIEVIEESYAGSMISMYAANSGEVDITCTIKIGENGSIHSETFTCTVYVYGLQFEMNVSTELRLFSLRDGHQDIHLAPDSNVGWDGFTAVSSDTSVVRAYISSDWLKLTPVNTGEATVTVTMHRAHLAKTVEIPVFVEGMSIQLSRDEAELAVGETIVLSPIIEPGHAINMHFRNFQSSNENVARVDGEGAVCALNAGTTIITFETELDTDPDDGENNYIYARAQCVVTVTDESTPLTLNATHVKLGWNESYQLKAMWNGEEINDAVWTSDDNAISVSSTGLLYLRHHWMETNRGIITATVTRGDETYTAYCQITGRPAAEHFEMEEACSLNVGDEHYMGTTIASSVDGESYTIVMTSSDDAIACFPYDDQTLRALAPGHVTVLAEMKNSAGETVATRTCEVYVGEELPEVDSFRLAGDVFYLTLKYTAGGSCHVDPIIVPNYIGNLSGVTITAEDPEIVEVDGHEIWGLKPGQTTITATLDEYGNTYTATVYVMDLTLSASASVISSGDTVDVTLNRDGIPTDDVIDIVWQHDDYFLSAASGKLGQCTYRGRHAGLTRVTVRVELPTVTFTRDIEITVENEGYLLSFSDYQLVPNECFTLSIMFVHENGVWSSTDDSIATVDQSGLVSTLDYGECDIILTATVGGETVTASCHVTVTDGTWVLRDIWLTKLMYVGSMHQPELDINSTCGDGPEQIVWNSSDPSILAYNEEDGHVHAYKAGTATLVVTAIDGSKEQTLSTTITVAEPAVRLSDTYPSLAPNTSTKIELITGPGLTVTKAVWSSGNASVLDVAQDGTITMVASRQGRFQYTAEVTLSDGSTHTLVGWCECLSQE